MSLATISQRLRVSTKNRKKPVFRCESLECRRVLATMVGTEAEFVTALANGDACIDLTADITLSGAELEVTSSVIINGHGFTLDAAGLSRVFNVDDGDGYVDSIDVDINDLTITGGSAATGAGIRNVENLTITGSTITGNTAIGTTAIGGGLYNRGTLMVDGSTVSGNTANFTSAMLSNAYGGGLASVGTSAATNVSSSTVSGNSAIGGSGGGIFVAQSSLTVSNSVVSGNFAGATSAQLGMYDRYGDVGGGIAVVSQYDGSGYEEIEVAISNTDILSNTVQNDVVTDGVTATPTGGGLYVGGFGTVSVLDSTVTGNSAYGLTGLRQSAVATRDTDGMGGGIATTAKSDDTNAVLSAVIDPTTVSGNYANALGGGVFVDGDADDIVDLLVEEVTISSNIAGELGGGMYVTENIGTLPGGVTPVRVLASTIDGNTAVSDGGGVWIGDSDVDLINSTLSGNTAGVLGGGIYSYQDPMVGAVTNVYFSTLTLNSAGFGGGIYHDGDLMMGDSLSLTNSIASDNTAGVAEDLFDVNTDADISYSLVADEAGNDAATDMSNITMASAMLGPLADNGGPTFTHDLMAMSPAIDHADPASTLAVDQRGAIRPGGMERDMGAVETDGSFVMCDFDGNASCDTTDVDLLTAEIAAGGFDLTYDVNGDGMVDTLDLDQWLSDAGELNLGPGLAYLPADANLDGVVDGLDFIAWNTNKFTATTPWSGGNFNADSVIDGSDFIIWNTYKFQSSDENHRSADDRQPTLFGEFRDALNNVGEPKRVAYDIWDAVFAKADSFT